MPCCLSRVRGKRCSMYWGSTGVDSAAQHLDALRGSSRSCARKIIIRRESGKQRKVATSDEL